MIEVSIVTLAAAFGAAVLFHGFESRAWRAERKTLLDAYYEDRKTFTALAAAERTSLIDGARDERKALEDRVMARTYQEFVYHTTAGDAPDPEQLTTDEIEAKWYEAKERELATAGNTLGEGEPEPYELVP